MVLYDVPAPAKLNLFLHVVGRRSDGYHLLQTVFRFIDLCDTLDFERRDDGLIVCESPVPGLASEDDLVLKAARMLQRATGTPYGAQILYRKVIPTGGGLGGGSSDAASTLLALNKLWGTGLSRRQLMKLALTLGADVPVFIFGQPAFAEGIGEILAPVAIPDHAYVVVKPPQSVPTQGVFSSPDLTRDTSLVTITVFTDWQTIEAKRYPANARQPQLFGRNDLQPVVFEKYRQVREAASWLTQQGIQSRMTGSGACLFAEFVTIEQARMNQQKIAVKMSHCPDGNAVIDQAWACRGLIDHPLRHWTNE